MESVITSVVTAAILGIFGFIYGRFTIKTKTEAKVDSVCQRVEKLEEAIPIIMRCHLAQLVALKKGKIDGECDRALEELNNYLIEK